VLDVNENYFVSTYMTDFNSLEMISASDVKAQMNKSAVADVGDFPLWHICVIGTLQRGIYINDLTEYTNI